MRMSNRSGSKGGQRTTPWIASAMVAAAWLAASGSAWAATATSWTTTAGGTYNWSTGSLWNNGSPDATTTTLGFFDTGNYIAGSIYDTTNDVGNLTLSQLTLGGGSTSGSGTALFNIHLAGGSSLTVANGGVITLSSTGLLTRRISYTIDALAFASNIITINGAGNGTYTITSAGFQSGVNTFTANGTSTLTFAGDAAAMLGTTDQVWTGSGAGGFAFTGNFALAGDRVFNIQNNTSLTLGGSISGAQQLTKSGSGKLFITGNTGLSYASTLVNGGTLAYRPTAAGGSFALGSGAVTIDNGATFGFNGAASASYTLSSNLVVASGGGTIDFSPVGNVTAVQQFAGSIQLGGALTLRSVGTGSGSFDGPITLTGGDRTITLNNTTSTDTTIDGSIGQDGTPRQLTLANVGTRALVISGTANTWSGGTLIQGTGGFVQVAANSSLGTSAVTVQGGGRLRLTALTNVAGGQTVMVQNAGVVEFAAPLTTASGLGMLNTASAGILSVTAADTAGLNLQTAGLGSLYLGVLTSQSLTSGWTPAGSTYRIAGGLDGSTLTINGANMLTGATSVVYGTGSNANTITVAQAQNYTLGTTINGSTFTASVAGALGSGNVTVNGGTLNVTAANALGSSAALTINSAAATFAAANNYTGATTLSGGSLILSGATAAGRLSGTSAVRISGGAVFQNGDSTVANNTAARVNAASAVTLGDASLGGGTYTLGLTTTASLTQAHSTLTLNPGFNILNSVGTGTTPITLDFTGAVTINRGMMLSASPSTNFVVKFDTPPALTPVNTPGTAGSTLSGAFVVGWDPANPITPATFTNNNWATLNASKQLAANTTYDSTSLPANWAGKNVTLDNGPSNPNRIVAANVTANSLRMVSSASTSYDNSLTISSGITLTLGSGGLMIASQGVDRIFGPGTIAAPYDLYLWGNNFNAYGATINAKLSANAGIGALVVTGNFGGGTTGSFILTNTANAASDGFRDLYLDGGRVLSQTQGALGQAAGTIRSFGGSLGFSTVVQTVPQDIVVGPQGLALGPGVYTELQGSLTSSGTVSITEGRAAGQALYGGLVYLNPGSGKSVTGTGGVTISANALAVSSLANLPGGNLNIAGGVLILGGAPGNGVMTYSDLVGARGLSMGTGAGQWQLNSGGFAARGAKIVLDSSFGGPNAFDRNFTLGYAGTDASGNPFSNAGLEITAPISLSAMRTITLGHQGPGVAGALAGSVVQKISGDISGSGALQIIGGATGSGTVSNTALGELVLAGHNTWIGALNLSAGSGLINTGPGALAIPSTQSVFVRFDDTALGGGTSIPQGTGAPNQLVAFQSNAVANTDTNAYGFGFLFTGKAGGQSYALPSYTRLVIGGDNTTTGDTTIRAGTLGATSDGATGGAATLTSGAVLLPAAIDSASLATSGELALLVRDGSFQLGDGSSQVSFIPINATRDGSSSSTRTAFSDLLNAGSTRKLIKRGAGTLVLGNLAYTSLGTDGQGTGGTSHTSRFSWQIGRALAGNDPATGYFDGAVRGRSSSASASGAGAIPATTANSLESFGMSLRGGVYEIDATPAGDPFTATFTLPLGTAAGQVNWGPGGGGFAAFGGPVTVNIGGTGAAFEWESTNFVGYNGGTIGDPLIFGSSTATDVLTFANSIGLDNQDNRTKTREFRVLDNPAVSTDCAVISGAITNRGNPAGTGGTGTRSLLKTGDGMLVLANGANNYNGDTIIRAGTLGLGADASGVGGHTALGSSSNPVLLGDTTGSANASLLITGPYTVTRDILPQLGNTGSISIGGSNTSGTATFGGTITVNRNLILAAAAGGTVAFTGTFQTPGNAGAVTLTKSGSGTLALNLNNLKVQGTDTLTLAPGMDTMQTAVLNVAGGNVPTAKLDMTDNKLVVQVAPILNDPAADKANLDAVYNQLMAQITAGSNGAHWNGAHGITSSTAAGDNLLHAVGILKNADYFALGGGYNNWGGVPVDDHSILISYTYAGDADLDGVVTDQDFFLIDSGYSINHPWDGSVPTNPVSGWFNADFNYDGQIDAQDYFLIDHAYYTTNPLASTLPGGMPEPASLGLLAVGALGLLRRRR